MQEKVQALGKWGGSSPSIVVYKMGGSVVVFGVFILYIGRVAAPIYRLSAQDYLHESRHKYSQVVCLVILGFICVKITRIQLKEKNMQNSNHSI